MSLSNNHQTRQIMIPSIVAILFILFTGLFFTPIREISAADKDNYSDGIYRYKITSEEDHKVQLIGIEKTEEMEELYIPGKVTLNELEYSVESVDLSWNYYSNDKYNKFYKGIRKLTVADNFTGAFYNPVNAFPNLDCIEFYGKTLPKEVTISISNRSIRDFLFIVPKGMEEEYSKVIHMSINYYMASDLYEQDIEISPTIVSKVGNDIEYKCFAIDGFIYRVTSSAKEGDGKVQLVGITYYMKRTYIKLPDKVKYNGYTYELTSLGRFSMIASGASTIIVPDSVTEMESSVFDNQVELLFLSKNCKVIPRLIADENNDSYLRFVYVPEGVTTLLDNAFNNIPGNTASIILPSTISKIGKKALYHFKLITFLNKKPLDNVAEVIMKGTTVKVPDAAVTTFQKVLGTKASVIAAKNIVKAKELTVNQDRIMTNMSKTSQLTASLTKGSNESIYWLSTNPVIVTVSSKGVITPKKAGTAYVVAYTRTSGRHKAIEITVTDTTFADGIYTYRITDPSKKTVSLCQVRPDKDLRIIEIPQTVTYKKIKYTVTGVIANPDDTKIPLIPKDYCDNQIIEIIFPATIGGTVGYLGELRKINRITFMGKTAPEAIKHWYLDDGLLAYQAVIYVPAGSVNSYTTSLWMLYGYDTYVGNRYGCFMDYNIVETNSDQMQRFVVDGILYRVINYAGKKNGEVAVKGVDLNLEKITINKTVTYKGYTYHVTEIHKGALSNHAGKEIVIDKSIKRRSTAEKYNAPINYVIE